MSIINKLWNEIEKCEEPTQMDQKIMEVYNTILYSPFEKFEEIRDFVEKVDVEDLEQAIWNIQNIPSMEEGDYDDDDYMEDTERYHLFGNVFRESYLLYEFQKDIWNRAKPKKKKRFF